jgi:hypothetical protein
VREGWWDREIEPRHTLTSINAATWPNFWTTRVSVGHSTRSMTPFLTRGGPRMGMPASWNIETTVANSTAVETQWSLDTILNESEDGDRIRDASATFSLRPAPAWRLSLTPRFRREIYTQQYITRLDGGRSETYGSRYVFGTIDRSTPSMQMRLGYTFKPDLNLDFYAEPFAASGRYERVGELLAPGSRLLRVYGENGTSILRQADGSYAVADGDSRFSLANQDFEILSFRSNLVLRWEWRPGSTLYLVWQQNRASTATSREKVGFDDLFGSLSAPGDNFFAIKASLWIAK